MVIAILLGICAGVAGFLPLLGGLKLTKRHPNAGTAGSMFLTLVALIVSFALLVVFALLCVNLDRPNVLPFTLAEALALCAAALGYGVWLVLRK